MEDPDHVDQLANLDEALEAVLQRAARTKGLCLGLLEAAGSPDDRLMAPALIELDELAIALRKIIVKDPRFPGETPIMIRSESGASGFYPNFFCGKLVNRLLRSRDSQGTIRWLEKVLTTKAADGQSITALWGVRVEQSIEIAKGMSIVPIYQIPDSSHKRWIQYVFPQHGGDAIFSSLLFTPPESALVTHCRIDPFLHRLDGGEAPTHTGPQWEQLKDVILVLTIVGPRVPLSAGHWFTFDDPDLEEAHGGGGREQALMEIVPVRYEAYPPLDPTEAKRTVAAYLALQGNLKDKVRVALERLSQAMLRHNAGDCAVDLATALEALVGDAESTEMAHKVRIRAARLIGGTEMELLRNAEVVKATYDIRSKLVHTGRVTQKHKTIRGETMDPTPIATAGTGLLVRLIAA